MKAGTTQKIGISLDVDLKYVESIIFTLDGGVCMTKIYPGEVQYHDDKFLIPLTQQETTRLAGEYGNHVAVEAQINFMNKAVAKSVQESFYASDSLATVIIDGNAPDDLENIDVNLLIDDSVVYAGDGTVDYNSLKNKPLINGCELLGDKSLADLGIDIFVSKEVEDFVEEHKEELKGDPGKPGKDGENGKDYVHIGEIVTEEGSVTKLLNPNIMCLFANPLTELTIHMPDDALFYDEYNFMFTASAEGCILNIPTNITWAIEPNIEASKYYEVSIMNGIAVISLGMAVGA